jgi:uncharacterized protein (TIGR02646 family)
MQYIRKQQLPPADWDTWFTTATGRRSFDYGLDYDALTDLIFAKQYLIDEQHGLCAYCQGSITIGTSSIEHVIPKEFNLELSTSYYNLVAVCKSPPKDENGKLHCDKEKQNKLLTPFIFASNSDVTMTRNNSYFAAGADGIIRPKDRLEHDLKIEAEAFISILHLNHTILKEKRVKDVLDGLIDASRSIPQLQKAAFWQSQFSRVIANRSHPFRQFLLIFILSRIGLN